jgi:hypothetical protein
MNNLVKYNPVDVLMKVLESFDEIEWGRGSIFVENEEDLAFPPFLVWRYKQKNQNLENLIVEAVNSFNGKIEWKIVFSRRNWFISPRKVEEFRQVYKGKYRTDTEARSAFAELEPNFGKMANQEVPLLAEHIKKFVMEKLDNELSLQTQT